MNRGLVPGSRGRRVERIRMALVCMAMGATLHFSLREHVRELKRGRPGQRFQDRYRRAHRPDNRCGAGQRIALGLLALICVAIGLVLSVFPGPAIPFFFLGGALLASESRIIARFMDWSEVQVRKIVKWAKRRWSRMSVPVRAGLIGVLASGAVAVAYLGYRLFIA